MKSICSLVFLCCLNTFVYAQQALESLPFRNPDLPTEERVKDIISRLTLDEKVQLMKHESSAVPRLGIPAYNWWNEALHGVARTQEKVTVFPQAIGMAATFDVEALQKMADITSTEGRALYNESVKQGAVKQYYGLTYWTPNINIFRDPRWGRGQETYGEDPYLTAKMGTAMVHGLEGNDPHYLKAVACAKHFAVHSGPEPIRHSYDARPSYFDLWDTYLPAFRELVTKAKVHGVMCAYNRLDGSGLQSTARRYISPLEAGSFDRTPPTYVEVAQWDCLHDEGVRYAQALKDAGIPVELTEVKDAMHGYDIALGKPFMENIMAYRIAFLRRFI